MSDQLKIARKILKRAEAEYKSGRLKPEAGYFLHREGHGKTCACAIGAAVHGAIIDGVVSSEEIGALKDYKKLNVAKKNYEIGNCSTDALSVIYRDFDESSCQDMIVRGFDDGFCGAVESWFKDDSDSVYKAAYNFGKKMKKLYGGKRCTSKAC